MEELLIKAILHLLRWIFVAFFAAVRGVFRGAAYLVRGGSVRAQNRLAAARPSAPGRARATAPDNPLARRFDAIARDAEKLRDEVVRDRASDKLIPVLDDYVVAAARDGASRLRRGDPRAPSLTDRARGLEVVLAQLDSFVEQRQTHSMRHALGDADALANACYRRIVEFARGGDLPLASADPVTLLTDRDLAIWTAFIPTGVAPIFLPPDFFSRVAWWPALAHEIGHDFFAATGSLEDRLRVELGLPPEQIGRIPIQVRGRGIQTSELVRVLGGWLEEIFCDLFATLMLGPAYGATMVELFAEPAAPWRVVQVDTDAQGLYDPHPPRHLRVLLTAHVLRLIDEDAAAAELEATWRAAHADDLDGFPARTSAGVVTLPVEPVRRLAERLVSQLHGEPFAAFAGRSLSSIPGLDWGPYEAAATRRVVRSLLSGQAAAWHHAALPSAPSRSAAGFGPRSPSAHDPRLLVAGAVLASREAPDRAGEIMRRVRAAVVGEAEWADARVAPEVEPEARPARQELREAMILHAILAPPPSLARRRRGSAGGVLAPRSPWLDRRS